MKVRIPKNIPNDNVQNVVTKSAADTGFTRDTSRKEMHRKMSKIATKNNTPLSWSPPPPQSTMSPLGFEVASEAATEVMLEEITGSTPKVLINTHIEIMDALEEKIKELEKNGKMDIWNMIDHIPYDDMIIQLSVKGHEDMWIRGRVIILQEDKINLANIGYFNRDPGMLGYVIISTHEGSKKSFEYCSPFGFSHKENSVLCSPGLFVTTMNVSERKAFRDMCIDHTDQLDKGIRNMTNIMTGCIDSWLKIIYALNNPEIREIWETHTREYIENNKPKTYVYNKRPLKNIKRIYMCEPFHTGREITRHTDKWYVREHIAHSKNGKEFIRRGHYKGPKAKDETVQPEPRKRVIDTFDDSTINRDENAKFLALLNSVDEI